VVGVLPGSYLPNAPGGASRGEVSPRVLLAPCCDEPSRQFACKPATIDHAAALPLAGLTAWQSLIDYRAVDFAEEVRDVDVVFEVIGGDYAMRSVRVLKPGGLLITAVERSNAALAAAVEKAGRRFAGIKVEPDQVGLEAMARLVDAGAAQDPCRSRFPDDGDRGGARAAGKRPPQRQARRDGLARCWSHGALRCFPQVTPLWGLPQARTSSPSRIRQTT